uniref:Uncharacterized protein n=1 Tax=Peronospora matthiolae TaxID=2874970 RepID=A0AAV1VCG1_9STRA
MAPHRLHEHKQDAGRASPGLVIHSFRQSSGGHLDAFAAFDMWSWRWSDPKHEGTWCKDALERGSRGEAIAKLGQQQQ